MQDNFVILHVEDDPDDQLLVRTALGQCDKLIQLYSVETGLDGWDYLRKKGKFLSPGAAPRPDLILLDMNLPGISGDELLRRIRDNLDLRPIPVVMMTMSSRDADVALAYKIGANSYVVKPDSYQVYLSVMHRLQSYWLKTVLLPGNPSNARPKE